MANLSEPVAGVGQAMDLRAPITYPASHVGCRAGQMAARLTCPKPPVAT